MKTLTNKLFKNAKGGSKKISISLFFFFLSLTIVAQTNTWNITGAGNWNRAANWSLGVIPTASHDVVIPNAATGTISINTAAKCKSLLVEGGDKSANLQITSTNSLTITNSFTINAGTLNNTSNRTFNVLNGTLTARTIIMEGTGSTSRKSTLNVTGGKIKVSGDIVMGNNNNFLTFLGSGILDIGGNFNTGVLTPGTGTVIFSGTNEQTIKGANTVSFYNLLIDKVFISNKVYNVSEAISVANNCTINNGTFILQASDDNCTVNNDLTIAASGILTHTVNWDATGKLLRVSGNIAIDGAYNYSTRTHVQMDGSGTKYLRTGPNVGSGFSILTLQNGNFFATGDVTVNDNFWAPFNSSASFHTNGFNTIANAGALISGGTFYVDGGSATVSGGTLIGVSGMNGSLNISSGTLTTDNLTNGDGTLAAKGTITQSGGTLNINANANLSLYSQFNCSSNPIINIKGNWINNSSGGFVPASSKILFNGSSNQTIGGNFETSFYSFEINNPAGVNLSQNSTINNSFLFTNGKIVTGVNTLKLGSSATISGASSTKYVNGNLEMGIATGNPVKKYEIGDNTNYTPVVLNFNSVTTPGTVAISSKGSDHPNIGSSFLIPTKSVNRYYKISGSSFNYNNYSAVFNFIPSDIDAGANTTKFIIGDYESGSWDYPNPSNKNSTNIQADGLTSFGDFAIAETNALPPTITSQPVNAVSCVNGTAEYNASFKSNPAATTTWQVSVSGGGFTNIVPSSLYTITNSLVGTIYTSNLKINTVSGAMSAYRFRCVISNPGGSTTTANASLSLIAQPIVNISGGSSSICYNSASGNLNGSVSGGNATGGIWSDNAGGSFSPSATDLNAVWTPNPSFSGNATITLTATGGCSAISNSKVINVQAGPAFTVSPAVADCQFTGIKSISTSTSSTVASTSTSFNIPDYSATGVANSLSISGIPANAVIQNVEINFNSNHPRVRDLIINLKAPNGNILNLVKQPVNSGSGFTNTTVSMVGTNSFSSATAPYNGIFAADAANATIASVGYLSNSTSFDDLLSVPNGNWDLSIKDAVSSNSGRINSWSITITWTLPILWSPSTDLFIDPQATIPYTGGTNSTVYVKSDNPLSNVYDITYFSGTGCNTTKQVSADIYNKPVLDIYSNYCFGGGKIELRAEADVPLATYLWTTGETTSSIVVDIATSFGVIVKTANNCSDTAKVKIGLELITNGDFESGNTGFTSAYTYINKGTANGLNPEKTYTVNDNPTFNHSNFWGKDHTTNGGNFMIINGNGSTPPVDVWSKTISVTPNTDYYFSAWAISLNSVGPYADLQFKVNNVQVGTTTGALPARPNNNNPPYNWTRFYGTWNSGSATTAVVSIIDLVTVAGGNDFGLDDISFGTLTPFITLTSPGKNNQTVCKNSAIENITYSIGGMENGPNVSGLPPGVTGNYSNGVYTISGTPTVAGTYPFEVKSFANCISAIQTGQIIVNEQNISLTSAAGTDNQVKCLEAISPIKYTLSGKATGATVSGLPAGVVSGLSGKILTISGTPTVTGTFNYTITTSGICDPVSINGTIKIEATTISLNSAVSTTNQTVCLSSAMAQIKYNTGGNATGATVTGLPAGVTGTYNAGVFTISGSPSETGTFNYMVSAVGSCTSNILSGTINVVVPTISLNSAAATTNQTICLTSAITSIKYNIGGSATGATVTGLPSGLSSNYSAGIFTISGTPTAAGTFNYVVKTTSSCAEVTMGGTIKVNSSTLVLSSAASTANQSLCVSTAVTQIKYNVGGVATGAVVSGLPAGVNSSYSGGVLTISGSPSVTGNFVYTVSTTGTCAAPNLSGTINVVAPTISLNSAAATTNQTICLTSAIAPIKYNIGGSATGATVTGLPSGLSSNYSAGIFTISGTPTISGSFNYSVTTTSSCANLTMSGTINIEFESITLTSGAASVTQTLCINQNIIPVTFAINGTGANVTGLPNGLNSNYNAGTLTISGTPLQSGAFTLSITTTGNCQHANVSQPIYIYPTAIGGNLPSASLCSGGSGSLVLSSYVGTIDHWETSTDSLNWSVVANTTNTLSYNNPGYAIFYRVLVTSGPCSSEYSNVARVGIHNLWTGNINTDWMNPYNWSDALLPTLSCANLTIPVTSNYPVLSTGTVSVNNLVIFPGATLHANDALLQIAGTISGGGKIDADNSTIELNGDSPQNLSGSMFVNNTINNIKISNNKNVTVTGADTLKMQGELSFGISDAKVLVNKNFTLLSNEKGTASILDMTSDGQFSGNDILGSVTVERYIPKHPKAWQLLGIPTKGSTIQESWQEGNIPMGNNRPGRGIILTGNVAAAVAKGFDISTPSGAGMKTYNSLTNNWDGVPATNIEIANKKGYLVMVRGDRSVFTSTAPATEVTLRTMGQLYTTGVNAPLSTNIAAGKMESVGNPYACAIDFSKITKTGGIADMFYVWDPLLTNAGQSAYGLGGYQTFTRAGSTYEVTPGGGSYTGTNRMIESGQAIIISAPYTSGTVSFTEKAKVSGSNMVNRPANNWQMFRANIYTNTGGSRVLVDGVMNQFDAFYSNNIDEYDAPKLSNTGENISLLRYTKNFSVESRNGIDVNDTIFYNIANMRAITYEFDFVPYQISEPDINGYLHDKYLGTETLISLTQKTTVSFTITSVAASKAADRFYITFRPNAVLPVNFTSISAMRNREKEVNISWNVENEIYMEKYEVEKSLNGRDFHKIAEVAPRTISNGSGIYNSKDLDASPLDNYYRIKGISIGGRVQYTSIAKVSALNFSGGIAIMPNPVQNKQMNIHFTNVAAGNYSVTLINNLGQVVYDSKLETTSSNTVISINVGKLPRGFYTARINGNIKFAQKIIIE